MASKEGGGPLCSLDCDPLSLCLKVLAHGTNESLGRERSNPCCPGVMAVPGFSPFFFIYILSVQLEVDDRQKCRYSKNLFLFSDALHQSSTLI